LAWIFTRIVGQRGSDRLRPAEVISFRSRVQSFEFLGGEPYVDDLHGLSPTSRSAPAAALHVGHVVAGLCLVGPLLNLILRHHEQIV